MRHRNRFKVEKNIGRGPQALSVGAGGLALRRRGARPHLTKLKITKLEYRSGASCVDSSGKGEETKRVSEAVR
jgi:hypothetical protein